MLGSFSVHVGSTTKVFYRGSELRLDLAPTNEHGTIELLKSNEEDGTVWLKDDILFYDSNTKKYFPDQDTSQPSKDKDNHSKKPPSALRQPLKSRRRKKKSRKRASVYSEGCIETVGKGTTVFFF